MTATLDHLKNLKNTEVKQEWVKAYAGAKKEGFDEKVSYKVANKWIQNWHKENALNIQNVHMNFVENNNQILMQDAQGEVYFDAILGSEVHDSTDGWQYSPGLLKKWADQLNENNFSGDINHEWTQNLLQKFSNHDDIKALAKVKPGLTKKVKAWYEDGVLKIRGWIDKRYKPLLEKANGLSLEAHVANRGKTVTGGDLVGWSFMTDKSRGLGQNIAQIEKITG